MVFVENILCKARNILYRSCFIVPVWKRWYRRIISTAGYKRGNRNLRKVMHFPALAAIRTDERFRDIFLRIVSRHGIKMKAIVAIQRKLLELTFILWKSNSYYNAEHEYQIISSEEIAV